MTWETRVHTLMLDVYCQMVHASTPKAMMTLANRAKRRAISVHARGEEA